MACMAFILFSNSNFSSKLGNEDCENCENYGQGGGKFDLGEVNPH